MKFAVNALLSACVLQGASAFSPAAPKAAFKTSTALDMSTTFGSDVLASGQALRGVGTAAETMNRALSTPMSAPSRRVWEEGTPIKVQGGSLKTWSFASPSVERVQVGLMTEGRPLDADVELWQGPDNTPAKMRVYIEDGAMRPFNTMIETPRGPNTVAIRNIGQLEFPMDASVVAETGDRASFSTESPPRTIQGGALKTYPFDPYVDSVQILLETDGRPLNARIELLQGPNNNKQVIELYTEDGMDRPFYSIVETPGSGNVVRIVNTAPMEFPLYASIEAYDIGDGRAGLEPVISGDADGFRGGSIQW